ncbi:MAG: NADH-quinone oxidoreductase subunit NuoN [Acidiferrobacteraceae bacterium]|jgi:NADH-quinone oxidoreductase subunit N|nr:NADH-quinone oxidoreductase subunit NuoN [Acidiferrobacteraceae bacterium]MDP6140039.1 NADH-quinone oxidoreductase subunit NuoN [Arenicellales bacterium]MDP6312900.1 NADH-quinone oxidoreductase subunit NuoN [Arenicellales bacterium]MDP7120522.1 NADH-quinone oxidoreductase subunit NuoN [Arenicellales bacterium]MDP7490673.1 NADH-quinone oxidoreductase subunit NuoN [Arenicellales bacterium]|tara:strand:+ start:444 stop:1907 length:1464 start_codon:yes stop_codon:yes gene_type:complete
MQAQTLLLSTALPEILVSVMACAILLLDLYLPRESRAKVGYGLSVLTLLAATVIALGGLGSGSTLGFNGLVVRDDVSGVLKAGVLLGTAAVLVYSRSYAVARRIWRGEFFVLALLGVVGMMVMISAAHLISLYVGLELLALCLYAMIALQRDSVKAAEAAMKYFILGALASGILLYGMSLLYGLTGSLSLRGLQEAAINLSLDNLPLLVALVLVVAGLLFKLGAVPFHMWVPDVYEGSATCTTLYLSAAPKLAGFAIVLRLLAVGLDDWLAAWQDMLVVSAILSVVIGNTVAIAQTNIKRMLAYSTISHMGFLLLGFLAGSTAGYSASMLYAVIYTVVSLAAFGIVLALCTPALEIEQLNDLKGLNRRQPWLAFLMLLVMFTLAGVPPTVGFYAKFAVLQAALSAGFISLVIVAVIFAVIGAFYYLRVVKIMYFDEPGDAPPVVAFTGDVGATAVLSVNALVLVLSMPWIGALIDLLSRAVAALPSH